MIEIEAPGGGIVEFPDGMSDAEIEKVMRREYGGPKKPAEASTTQNPGLLGTAYDIAQQAADGFNRGVDNMLNLPGAIMNIPSAIMGSKPTFKPVRVATRFSSGAKPQTTAGKYAASTAEAVGSSVLPSAGLIAKADKLRKLAPKSTLHLIGRDIGKVTAASPGKALALDGATAATGGAAVQFAQDAGAGPGWQMLAALGASSVPAFAANRLSALRARKIENLDKNTRNAHKYINRAIERTGKSATDMLLDFQKGQAATRFGSNSKAYLPESITELGGTSTQGALDTLVVSPGRARHFVREMVDKRQEGLKSQYSTEKLPSKIADRQALHSQQQRLLENTARAFEIKASDSAIKTEGAIKFELKKASAPLYKRAFRESAEDFDLSKPISEAMATMANLQGKSLKTLKRAVALFLDNGKREVVKNVNRLDSKTGEIIVKPALKKIDTRRPLSRADELERFDYAKKELDDMIGSLIRSGNDQRAAILQKFKNDLLDAVHGGSRLEPTKNITYSEARGLWSSGKSMQDKIELGRRALHEGSEVSVELIKELTPGELKLFRLGLYEAIRRNIKRQKLKNDSTQLYQRADVAEIIKAAMPHRKSAKAKIKPSDQFGELLEREIKMVQTRNTLANSSTAFRIDSQEDLNWWANLMDQLTKGSPIGALKETIVVDLWKRLSQSFTMGEAGAARAAELLTSTDPKVIEATLQRLAKKYGKNGVNDLMRQARKSVQLRAKTHGAILPFAASEVGVEED